MWIKALLTVVPAALFIAAPAPVVHADGACTALGPDAYKDCRIRMNLHCESRLVAYTVAHVTCTYPDGGRDECEQHIVPFSPNTETASLACTYVPRGAESTPSAGAAPESAPAAEPTPSQP